MSASERFEKLAFSYTEGFGMRGAFLCRRRCDQELKTNSSLRPLNSFFDGIKQGLIFEHEAIIVYNFRINFLSGQESQGEVVCSKKKQTGWRMKRVPI